MVLCRVDLLNAAIHGMDVGADMICACANVQHTSAARVVRTAGRAGRKVRGASERVEPGGRGGGAVQDSHHTNRSFACTTPSSL